MKITHKTIKEVRSFSELLDQKYGKPGSKKRDKFEQKSLKFIIKQIDKSNVHNEITFGKPLGNELM